MPHHHRSHRGQEPEPMGDALGCWVGCGDHGMAVCGILRIQLGSLRLDCHRRDLANFPAAIWYRSWSFVKLDGESTALNLWSRRKLTCA